ncbi:MAG: alpha/beta hydrolase [Phycisphaerae bacterium]
MLHFLIVAAFLATPPLAIAYVAWRVRRRPAHAGEITRLSLTFVSGIVIGTGLTMVYAFVAEARLTLWQTALACYLAISLLVMLKGLDQLLGRAVRPMVRPAHAEAQRPRVWRLVLAGTLRGVLLGLVALPTVMAVVMVYRPKVQSDVTPYTAIDPESGVPLYFAFQPASFRSEDGIALRGWFIPAQGAVSNETVVICHGLAASKANFVDLSRHFVPYGFNVFIFDFRAHGHSGGQLTSFGDLERRDVLAAVAYLKAQHPQAAEHVYGVGVSMGAAAMVAAAAEPASVGGDIQKLALLSTFDDLGTLTGDVGDGSFIWPMNRLLPAVALPIASATAGRNLAAFRPARLVGDVWPRPVLIVHATDDPIIPYARGKALFDAAFIPREMLTRITGGHNQLLQDEEVFAAVRLFLRTARPVPVVSRPVPAHWG